MKRRARSVLTACVLGMAGLAWACTKDPGPSEPGTIEIHLQGPAEAAEVTTISVLIDSVSRGDLERFVDAMSNVYWRGEFTVPAGVHEVILDAYDAVGARLYTGRELVLVGSGEVVGVAVPLSCIHPSCDPPGGSITIYGFLPVAETEPNDQLAQCNLPAMTYGGTAAMLYSGNGLLIPNPDADAWCLYGVDPGDTLDVFTITKWGDEVYSGINAGLGLYNESDAVVGSAATAGDEFIRYIVPLSTPSDSRFAVVVLWQSTLTSEVPRYNIFAKRRCALDGC